MKNQSLDELQIDINELVEKYKNNNSAYKRALVNWLYQFMKDMSDEEIIEITKQAILTVVNGNTYSTSYKEGSKQQTALDYYVKILQS